MLARSVTDVCFHVSSNAFCAAATALSMSFSLERGIWEYVFAVDGRRVVEVLAVDGLDELAADVVGVALFELGAVV